MKKLFFIVCVSALTMISCAPKTTLYTWNGYDNSSYNYLKNRDEKSQTELIETYNKIISKQKGTRNTVPPGIYADYGFLLVQSGKVNEGIKMLKMEVSLYTESAKFVNNIIKTYENESKKIYNSSSFNCNYE